MLQIEHWISPDAPCGISLTYPDIQRTPCLSTWGSRFKNKPAMTYSPTPTKVQYHRREES